MKKIMILLMCGSLFSLAEAQEVIATSGTVFENGNGSISFTVGEAVTGTLSSAATVLTQGFQQPFDLYIPSTGDLFDLHLSVFPNPAKGEILIHMDHPSGFQYQLYDIQGVLLAEGILTATETGIDLSSFESAVYILQVFNMSGEKKTFKIVKQ
ncbi:MAG: T9SS type A sorting domain-containing protein [Bacteroidales bacterium]